MATPTPPLAQRTFMTLGSAVLVVAILSWGQKVLIPLALAVLLMFILTPLVVRLQRRGVPRSLAGVLAVLFATGLLGGLGWLVTAQLRELAEELPQHTETIVAKVHALRGGSQASLAKLEHMARDVSRQIARAGADAAPPAEEKPVPVVVQSEEPMFLSVFPSVAGTVAEALAGAGLVIILTAFMLIRREDLRFRLILLVSRGRLPVTTRALDEAAERISAYLLMQLAVNAVFGGLFFVALWMLGVPYPLLWGCLAMALRFVPYLGTWVALALPLVLCVAVFPDWTRPAILVGVFLALELVTANVVEPLLFSHSTGVSPVALLVAAAFWTWLWGPLGLILSTPLTVCLSVLGRYVPPLRFFGTLLGSDPVLEADARYYQRLLAQDEDEATELVEDYLRSESREQVYDDVLLPALVRMKRDAERGDVEPDEERFICHTTRDILEELEEPADAPADGEKPAVVLVGCPARDEADELALRMFRQLLGPSHGRVEVLSPERLTAEMVRHVREVNPKVVCIASLPPRGLAHARYLCKRLRAAMPDLKILVGRWGQDPSERAEERLREAGADHVATTLAATRAQAAPLLQLSAPPAPRRGLQPAGR